MGIKDSMKWKESFEDASKKKSSWWASKRKTQSVTDLQHKIKHQSDQIVNQYKIIKKQEDLISLLLITYERQNHFFYIRMGFGIIIMLISFIMFMIGVIFQVDWLITSSIILAGVNVISTFLNQP